MAEQGKVRLVRCSDEVEVNVENEVAMQMEFLKEYTLAGTETNLLKGTDIELHAPNVSSIILEKVIEYVKYHLEAIKYGHSEEDIKTWDMQFVNKNEETLFDLIMASDYLHINNLLELLYDTVAEMIKDLSPEQIRQKFGIENDYTPEEEEEIRRENEWVFDN